ncbi:ATP-grasp domain-containing protein [Aquirufa ecclesiirivi]|uniref:ATP-grasp domain-containing protein n=1 Tax=Aquirufa ecclesiirivi TaxID=2715124 RepID=UPI003BB19D62
MAISNKEKILVIGSGWEQYELLKTIKQIGYSIIATHPNLNAEGFNLADSFYVKDSRDIKSHIEIAQSHQVVGIVTDNCDYSFYTASVVASKLKLPFADMQSAIYSNDKFLQRQACEKGGIKQPEFYQVKSLKELETAVNRLDFPVILKPVDSRGTFGITIIQNKEDVEKAFFDAIDNSPSHTLICEKFIQGTLVTVDGFCFKNGHQALTVASRKFEPGPKPITKEIIYPALFSEETNTRLLANHAKVVQALNYAWGHTHGEYLLTHDNEIYLVECANRGGGVYTSSVLVPLLTEINLNEILVNQSLGKDTYEVSTLENSYMKKSVILTFLDFNVGHVIKSINMKEVLDQPFTIRFRTIYSENDMVESIENCASRHSMLAISGKDSEDAQNNLHQFKELLQVQYYK